MPRVISIKIKAEIIYPEEGDITIGTRVKSIDKESIKAIIDKFLKRVDRKDIIYGKTVVIYKYGFKIYKYNDS